MRIRLSLILHATEDEPRVLAALRSGLGLPPQELRLQRLQGHFGNPILYYTAELRGQGARALALRLLRALPQDLRRALRQEAEAGRAELVLRLRKDELLRGRLTPGQENALELVLRGSAQELREVLAEEP